MVRYYFADEPEAVQARPFNISVLPSVAFTPRWCSSICSATRIVCALWAKDALFHMAFWSLWHDAQAIAF